MKRFAFVLALLGTSAAAMSDPKAPRGQADNLAAEATAKMVTEAQRAVGMPGITHFTEKRAVKWLYELRDEPNYRTHTYIVTLEGKFVKVCDSVGYGINASVQYSNPQRVYEGSGIDRSATFIPQPEPNGLFMPEGLAATYVLCVVGDDVKPVYVEPEVIVSPFPIQ